MTSLPEGLVPTWCLPVTPCRTKKRHQVCLGPDGLLGKTSLSVPLKFSLGYFSHSELERLVTSDRENTDHLKKLGHVPIALNALKYVQAFN